MFRQHLHILCVDDNEVVLEWLKLGLGEFGYDVDVSRNGFNALLKITKNPNRYGIIIVDLRMPGMDGFSLISQSRSAAYDGKFLIYASAITPEAHQRARELQVRRVVEKPARRCDVIQAVRDLQNGF